MQKKHFLLMIIYNLNEVYKMTQRKQPLLLLFIGGLLFLTGCIKKQATESKSLKRNQTIYKHIQETHSPIIKLADTINLPRNQQKLKEHIMIHNEDAYSLVSNDPYQDLAFIQYKILIDRHIKQLQRYLDKLRKKSDEKYYAREHEVQTLIAQLEQLKQAIIISEEYRQEKLKLAEHNIREHEIQTLITQLGQVKIIDQY